LDSGADALSGTVGNARLLYAPTRAPCRVKTAWLAARAAHAHRPGFCNVRGYVPDPLGRATLGVMPNPVVVADGTIGTLTIAARGFACALGKGGVVPADAKREGDMATPAGTWKLRAGFWRADRLARPRGVLPFRAIEPDMVWDDDPASPSYNTLVRRDAPDHPERLLRADGVYDVVVPLGFNDDPVVPGRGSAIFLHVARPDYRPTAGCVALALPDLLAVLETLDADPAIEIRG
jgi:L,D-peptidoglycan transpeptidase YkuD (ErfK/YbiS/YcfS/YnhG family)